MELRHLHAFVVVAEELHFGRAARRLHISQPPLSQRIRRLEKELSVQLFQRSRRRVELTAAGALLLEEARRLLEHAARVEDLARLTAAGEVGHVRIGVVGSALYGPVPRFLKAYRAAAPRVLLSVEADVTSVALEGLHDRTLDVVLVRPPVDDPTLAQELVWDEPLVAVLPAGDEPSRRRALPLATLAEEPFVLFPRALGPGYWDVVFEACRRVGFTPQIAHEATEIHTIVGLVAAGLGVSLAPECVRGLRLPGVRYRRLAAPAPRLPLTMAWRGDRVSPALQRFIEVVRAAR